MAILFPNDPTLNDTFVDANGISWKCTFAAPDPVRWEKQIDVDSVAIVNSSINSTVIGDITPADGAFVDITATQDLQVDRNATIENLILNGTFQGTVDGNTVTIKTRQSEVAGETPVYDGGSNDIGEFFVNIADRLIYIANSSGNAIPLNAPTKIISANPPVSPLEGQEWQDSTTGLDYTWQTDVDSSQWVAIVAQDNGGGVSDAPSDNNDYVRVNGGWAQSILFHGVGSPEGVVTAGVGSLYTDSTGGAGTTLYVKESGAGDTGWIAIGDN